MEKMTIAEIVAATGAEYKGADGEILEISTDSRAIPKGCLFLALEGERFDGHNYIAEALK